MSEKTTAHEAPLLHSRKQRLIDFVAWCGEHIKGDEKGQSQIFLDRLFQAYGHAGVMECGATLEKRIKKNDSKGTAFADLVWKPRVLIEMKKRGEDLGKHYRQAYDYWGALVPNRPRYVVLCNFDEFWVYDFDNQMDTPMDRVSLVELPERNGMLSFLSTLNETPVFNCDQIKVTREAADILAQCFKSIEKRESRSDSQSFILQMLVALFAEDIGLMEQYTVTRLLDECKSKAQTYDLIGGLFQAMNDAQPKKGGRYKNVPYFNGGLFANPARIELAENEMNLLKKAATYEWSNVRPEIFGTLFEHSLDDKERRAFGQHFTSHTDIMKIVTPTIVSPWREQIERVSNQTLTAMNKLLNRLQHFTVLDPACGSGNFLYLAYRELKRLEKDLIDRIEERFPSETKHTQRMTYLSPANFFGLDISPLAIELAKVTLVLGRKLAIDELKLSEPALPFDKLERNFVARDALIDEQGRPAEWPKADVIIGNPPFVGAKLLKPERGPDYVNAVRRAYPDVPGMADYCVYWIRKAADLLPPCTVAEPIQGRAGLVGTQNIRNNQSRVGGLDYVVKTGTIIEAVENQPWSGEANVHVSIANWANTRDKQLIPEKKKLWFKIEPAVGPRQTRKRGDGPASKEYELDFRECKSINSALSDLTDVSAAKTLSVNAGHAYTGQYPRHVGFMLHGSIAAQMLQAKRKNRDVIHPFIVGRELLSGGLNNRWVIDFQNRTILDAKSYFEPFNRLEHFALPYISEKAAIEFKKTQKTSGQDQNWLNSWWLHFRPRVELIEKIAKKSRYIVCSRIAKRPIFVFLSSKIRPGDALSCFAFDDDYSFGILQSKIHWRWFFTKCSKMKSDFRYTPESVFETFPWPQRATAAQVKSVAMAARALQKLRTTALRKLKGGLRALYRTLELPGANPLKDAHAALDAAVLAAYGFNAKKDLLAQLLALNLDVAARIEKGEPVIAPGIPPDYPKPNELISDDCIQPPGEEELEKDRGQG